MSSTDSTVLLNNYLQSENKQALLSWEEKKSGPSHSPEWTLTCKLKDEIVATGTGSTKAAAKDAAAKEALKALNAASTEDD